MKCSHLISTLQLLGVVGLSSRFVLAKNDGSQLCGDNEWQNHPFLCGMLQRASEDLDGLAEDMKEWANAHGFLVDIKGKRGNFNKIRNTNANQLPVVLAHGMGDSCFNSGMKYVTEKISDMLNGAYSICIPIGSSHSEDTKNGYLLDMDSSVDIFAAAIQEDPALKNGFHAIGFSQGNNIIRGYIAKYNVPAVHTFISVNGVNAGVGAVPYCRPDFSSTASTKRSLRSDSFTINDKNISNVGSMCDFLMEQASREAYTEFAQKHSFQANYWRDPRPSAKERYQKYCQLAVWNNEAGYINETLKENWAKTQKFIWIMAEDDKMVWPKEGEHWGVPDSNAADPFIAPILPMKNAEWYEEDLFGLRTADDLGKNEFLSFPGDHLQFSEDDLEKWIERYFKAS